jgi:hypothetical protein
MCSLYPRYASERNQQLSNGAHINIFRYTVAFLYVRYSFLLILISCDLSLLHLPLFRAA